MAKGRAESNSTRNKTVQSRLSDAEKIEFSSRLASIKGSGLWFIGTLDLLLAAFVCGYSVQQKNAWYCSLALLFGMGLVSLGWIVVMPAMAVLKSVAEKKHGELGEIAVLVIKRMFRLRKR